MSGIERFGVMEAAPIIDVEQVIDRARSLWRHASGKARTAHVELYVKTSSRLRVSRRFHAADVGLQHVNETGHALRILPRGSDRAGFAASSGLSVSAIGWTLGAAANIDSQRPALVPRGADVAEERFDLDAPDVIPADDDLRAALLRRPFLRSLEAGTTLEALVGAGGWIAVRRRHRFWGVVGIPRVRLVAQRGFEFWERCLDAPIETAPAAPIGEPLRTFELASSAAAPVVNALVDVFHGRTANQSLEVGPGWEVADDPTRPDGLSGGSFDDSGFPTERRALAQGGVWVGRLDGPGTFWRASFRNPPVESASNLVLASGDLASAVGTNRIQATHARVIRMAPGLWVLELEFHAQRKWLRVDPRSLLAACSRRLGAATVSSDGPIVPGLRFEGATVNRRE
jgi:hypothetical protein